MRLRELRLENFRSYAEATLNPCAGVTILHGANGEGKTNLLEAIHFLSTTKGFRTGRDADMVRWEADRCAVSGVVEAGGREFAIAHTFVPGGRKQTTVDGATMRPAEAIGLLHSVDFSSRDLSIVRGEPSKRREFADVELAQMGGGYATNLARYKKALSQRNHLLTHLASGCGASAELDVWDEQLVTYGEPLIAARVRFVEDIAPQSAAMHEALARGAETLRAVYEPDVEPGGLARALEGARRDDLRRAVSTRGPHKDDIALLIGGQSARLFGSQGQQRSAVLALKLAEAALVKERKGYSPLILLDDVLSDLDEGRRARLLELFSGDAQMIMTCTETNHLPKHILKRAKLVEVKASRLNE